MFVVDITMIQSPATRKLYPVFTTNEELQRPAVFEGNLVMVLHGHDKLVIIDRQFESSRFQCCSLDRKLDLVRADPRDFAVLVDCQRPGFRQ